MKQIPFTLDAFGPDGLLKEGYMLLPQFGNVVFAIRVGNYITVVHGDGSNGRIAIETFEEMYKLYRRTRTAEEVAREVPVFEGSGKWDDLPIYAKNDRIACVQAGMDEMK